MRWRESSLGLKAGQEQGFDVTTFTSEWLLTLFAYSFPLNFTYRVWDVFFIKGFTYILQVCCSPAVVLPSDEKSLRSPSPSSVSSKATCWPFRSKRLSSSCATSPQGFTVSPN